MWQKCGKIEKYFTLTISIKLMLLGTMHKHNMRLLVTVVDKLRCYDLIRLARHLWRLSRDIQVKMTLPNLYFDKIYWMTASSRRNWAFLRLIWLKHAILENYVAGIIHSFSLIRLTDLNLKNGLNSTIEFNVESPFLN